jgi:PAS domain S-box-containing protein
MARSGAERARDDFAEVALDAARMRTWAWDIATNEVRWSEGVDELFGMERGEFAGTFDAYLASVHPDDRAQVQETIERALRTGEDYEVSHRVLIPDGSVRWLFGRGQVTFDAQRRPVRMTGVVWDATARKQTETRIQLLARLYAVARAVNQQIVRVGSEAELFSHACRVAVEQGRFRFAWVGLRRGNEVQPVAWAGHEDGYLARVTVTIDLSARGRGPVGTAIREGIPSVFDDIATDPAFAPWREAALERGYRACAAFPLARGGEVVGAIAIYADEPRVFDAQEVALLAGLANDIGFALGAIEREERRRAAEEAVRRSEERYRTLVEHASDGIFLAEADGRLVDVNPAACELLGYEREALLAERTTDLLDYVRPAGSRATRAVAEGRMRRSDGRWVPVEISEAVLIDGRVLGIVRDVSERKLLQQRMMTSDRMASLGRLAAGVAHEVNNPLAYIMLNLERLQRSIEGAAERDPAAERRAIAEAIDGAERVRKIVRALVSLSRKDEEPIGPVDVHRALDTAVNIASARLRHRGRLMTRYEAARMVRGNELQLGQVFVNLLANAADALGGDVDRNEVRVRTCDDGDRVVVEVSDTGAGIRPDVIGQIFDPFFTTKPVGEGTGLGLTISHGIVVSFGGDLTVQSSFGEGSTFRVSLPASEPGPPSSRRGAGTSFSASAARVLVVDDEPLIAEAVRLALDRHKVSITTSSDQALAMCRSTSLDAVFCDLMMPRISGAELYAALRNDGGGVERRIIFMTGGAYTPESRAFLASIANPVIQKPFTTRALEEALEAVLRAERRAH